MGSRTNRETSYLTGTIMDRLRFLTAGESHGPGLCGILEGIPAGLALSTEPIDSDLKRRQKGYGRGGRMKIESDRARIYSGVRYGLTLGSPICLLVENRDWQNWERGMSPLASDAGGIEPVVRPRPGHADLAGALKYGHQDVRNILERSSARETAMKVALGAVAKQLLLAVGIRVMSYVRAIGEAYTPLSALGGHDPTDLFRAAEESDVRCPDPSVSGLMRQAIDKAMKEGYSLGGTFEIVATGVPAGLGSHTHWDRRLNARLSYALAGIQAIKGVEVGLGFEMSRRPGNEVMDEIFHGAPGYFRKTNFGGGLEGGISNGMPIVLRAAMKPIPTLRRPLRSVHLQTHEAMEAAYERSDVCAVPAAGVIGEAMVALVLADALLEKFGGDSLDELKRNHHGYMEYLKSR